MFSSFDDAMIVAIENNLLPNIAFKDTQALTLQDRMEHYGVPGVGVAVINDFKIAWHKIYGLSDR